jgi:hypothetical protein
MFYEHGWAAVIKIAFRKGPCQRLAQKAPQFSVNIGKDGPGSGTMTKKDGLQAACSPSTMHAMAGTQTGAH